MIVTRPSSATTRTAGNAKKRAFARAILAKHCVNLAWAAFEVRHD